MTSSSERPPGASAPDPTWPRLRGARVAVVNWRDLDHALAGGSERYAWELALALHEAGARVELITARDRHQARHEVRDGIAIVRGGGPFTYYAHAAWSLLRRRRHLDAVVDPECGIPSWSPLWVRRGTAVLLVVHHVHQEQFATYFPRPLALLGQLLERVAMRRVYRGRRTVAVSESTRTEMRAQLGWTGDIDILPNGTALPDVDDRVEDVVAAKDPDRVAVLGRLVPHKRVDLVLRAVHALRAERPALRLDVIGKGPEDERLRALAAALGIADRVTFHGFVPEEEKHALLRRAALHVCASDIEGWGQVVIEAAGHGVPTVARDVPGLRESIRDGATGWLVPDHPDLDVVGARLTDQLRTALRELAEPENTTLAVKACQTWASGFSWRRMRDQARTVIEEELHHG
ncbi:glycosyltransferase family 4 protein [Nocardioides sp. SYSU D00038]|uniref:glycosyltransferase family 4 protein n=1 Tax=Nocardioides sp. SYSU D00038 TaxID=2812554 RepID=UPI001967FDFE|nr:glycosyltransferase family 4 protein [Nocardioides sp. SYSU D00038]